MDNNAALNYKVVVDAISKAQEVDNCAYMVTVTNKDELMTS